MLKVTVIGCGHGGQALAADLSLKGCKVTLYAHPKHPGGIHALAAMRGINCSGLINQFVPIEKITMDMQKAMADCDYIFLALPSYAHEATFMEMLPFVKSGQTIVTLAANFAALICLKLLSRINKAKGIDIIDVASLPYVCRSDNKGSVEILAVKDSIAAASIPALAIHKHIRQLENIFPSKLVGYQDVLSLGMNITSGISHPVVTLMNAGRIGENKDVFYFYRDGVTPETADLMEKLDVERMRIGKQLGLEMYTYLELTAQYYGEKYDSIYQRFRDKNAAHNALPMCPTSLRHRYITENVGCTLVSWYSLGKLVQTESVVMANLINLASLLNNTNYMRTGSNLIQLHLHDKSLEEIMDYVMTGETCIGLPLNDSVVEFKQMAGFGGIA